MATKRVLPDKDFDRIIVRTHKLARNVTMRVKPDGLHVTVPPYSLSSKVLEVVEQYKQRLLEDWRKVSKKPIDLNFRIHTPCFRLWLEQGNFTCFSVRFTEEGVKIICPRNVDFSLPEVQRLVRNAIIRAMKKRQYQSFLLFDVVASPFDGLCTVTRIVSYQGNESRPSFLGVAG